MAVLRCKVSWRKKDFFCIERFLEFIFIKKQFFALKIKMKLFFLFKKKNISSDKKIFTAQLSKDLLYKEGLFVYRIVLEMIGICFLIKLFFQKLKKKRKSEWFFIQQLKYSILKVSSGTIPDKSNSKFNSKKKIVKNIKFFFRVSKKKKSFMEKLFEILFIFRKKKNFNIVKKIVKLLNLKMNNYDKKEILYKLNLNLFFKKIKKKKPNYKTFYYENYSNICFKYKSMKLAKRMQITVIDEYTEKKIKKNTLGKSYFFWNYIMMLFFSNGIFNCIIFFYKKYPKKFLVGGNFKNFLYFLIVNLVVSFSQRTYKISKTNDGNAISEKIKNKSYIFNELFGGWYTYQKKNSIMFVFFFLINLFLKKRKFFFSFTKNEKIFFYKLSIKFCMKRVTLDFFFKKIFFLTIFIPFILVELSGLTFFFLILLNFTNKQNSFNIIILRKNLFALLNFRRLFSSSEYSSTLKWKKKYGGKLGTQLKVGLIMSQNTKKKNKRKSFIFKKKNSFTEKKKKRNFLSKSSIIIGHFNFFFKNLPKENNFLYFQFGYLFQIIILFKKKKLHRKSSLKNIKNAKKEKNGTTKIIYQKKRKIFLKYDQYTRFIYFFLSNFLCSTIIWKVSIFFILTFFYQPQLILTKMEIKNKLLVFKKKLKNLIWYYNFFKKITRKDFFFLKKTKFTLKYKKKFTFNVYKGFVYLFVNFFSNFNKLDKKKKIYGFKKKIQKKKTKL
ncbi:hypothetical protein CMESO_342 (nucleomorph) [Chroomonas mesostigmatica CCMP1168]|uniref:Uncharacterized protein n=1 Tax=Chroomonas mesostigmatica CCMP1168 TaxID=1195612 RepID=J7G390_9CRYP|nr:hypothetical protein CMESO_342 [Chroomonas mesostigmatica CCMP1168]